MLVVFTRPELPLRSREIRRMLAEIVAIRTQPIRNRRATIEFVILAGWFVLLLLSIGEFFLVMK